MSQLQNSEKERARQATAIHELQLQLLRTEDGCIDTQQALTELEQCKTQLHQSVHSVIAQHKLYLSLSLSVLTAIFQVDLGLTVPECLHSGFYWS